MTMKQSIVLGSLSAAIAAFAACSPAAGPSEETSSGDGDGDTGDGDISVGDGDTTGTGGTAGDTCATTSAQAEVTSEPVDIIVVLDNSGSMEDELTSVENNINVNFANILETSGVDYRVILLSRHREGDRSESSSYATSICVTAPLSGLATCPSAQPIFARSFYQYSDKIESIDSLDKILGNYDITGAGEQDAYDLAPQGYKPWLRAGAKKVFLELTDDDATMTAAQFVSALTAKAPEFGTAEAPNFIFHSIIGIQQKANAAEAYLPNEPINTTECTGGMNSVANAGMVYQELSIMTGGLRFPLCEFANYDTVFQTIASDVVQQAKLACDFAIPPAPEGETLDYTKVAVTHNTAAGPTSFQQVLEPTDCLPNTFYIDEPNDHIYLCPETCNAVRANTSVDSSVDVNFTCESQIVVVK